MTDTSGRKRQSKGTPTGGQFAAENKAESEVELGQQASSGGWGDAAPTPSPSVPSKIDEMGVVRLTSADGAMHVYEDGTLSYTIEPMQTPDEYTEDYSDYEDDGGYQPPSGRFAQW